MGDLILGFDFQQNKTVYTPVQAWIHRDTKLRAKFTLIDTNSGFKYIASNGHNIAFNKNKTIDFKFAD